METECGFVKEVHGNAVCVTADAVSFCSSCTNQTCAMRQSKSRQVWMENILDARAGDRVYFVVPAKGVVISSAVMYGLPIVFLIGGIITGTVFPLPFIKDNELWAIVTGILFFAFSFIIVKILSKFIMIKKIMNPTMVKVERMP